MRGGWGSSTAQAEHSEWAGRQESISNFFEPFATGDARLFAFQVHLSIPSLQKVSC